MLLQKVVIFAFSNVKIVNSLDSRLFFFAGVDYLKAK